jgi:hypothetical protein
LIQIIAAAGELVLIKCIGFPVQTGVPMLSHTHQHLTDPTTRGFGRVAGFALIAAVLVLLLLALLTNPVLP